ncbi:helix-turn-helix domain-containing protein [Limnoglobus roseus]|uniref:Transcriptional regulator n=1 Tax=Limnoglobus roseus TaxID=2598579 RepID=A0A5C1AEC0_9BACT|nr:LuxR C-terminal-related transcriptional regulator [Limnoglobus roseus]QEL17591.1 transcriptional regulator [Limnoglobus roseus]
MSKSAQIRIEDARAVFRLVGDCSELGDDLQAWLQRMTDGAAALLDCQSASCGEFRVIDGRSHPVAAAFHGYDAAMLASHAAWLADPSLPGNPVYEGFERRPDEITAGVEDLIPRGEWEASRYYNELLVPMDMGDSFLSKRFIPTDGSPHYVTVSRPVRAARFTAREKAVATLLHDAVADRLGRALATSADPQASLPPRLRHVLNGLLDGDSEKQVAARLGVTAATVHEHVKRLYRRFGVQSRAELLAHFLRRYRAVNRSP